MKHKTSFYIVVLLTLILNACSGTAVTDFSTQTVNVTSDSTTLTAASQAIVTTPVSAAFDNDDFESTTDGATASISLKGDSIDVTGAGVEVNSSTATITAAGSYEISGTLNNGQIVVDTQDAEKVVLLLANVDIHNETGAPIYVANAEKVIITLADGTQNNISDGASYTNLDESGEPNAAIFSHDDLTINGSGSLIVTANYKNGIVSNDDLKITGGNLSVLAVNDGIKSKDSIAIKDGVITVNAGADGIQSTNEDEADKGYIAIEGGILNINAALDGIQAATSLSIAGGEINITSGGGSINSNNTEVSAKGLKAEIDIEISGGIININSADDSIHAGNNFTIQSGTLLAASGDDGIHADAALTVNGGEITITQSYEGLESANITINEGNVHLTTSDDGFNVAGGADGSAISGQPGENSFSDLSSYQLSINGGYIFVDAGGDGLDTNGNFDMTGGTVLINGPADDRNGPLDYNGTFNISGGFLVAVGSSGMAEAPSETSLQYSVIYNFESIQAAGTLVHIQDQNGNNVLTFMPTKEYQSVVLSSDALQNGMTYTLYTSGNAKGAEKDGLSSETVYNPGTEVASFTIASIVTQSGVESSGPGGIRGDHGGPP